MRVLRVALKRERGIFAPSIKHVMVTGKKKQQCFDPRQLLQFSATGNKSCVNNNTHLWLLFYEKEKKKAACQRQESRMSGRSERKNSPVGKQKNTSSLLNYSSVKKCKGA